MPSSLPEPEARPPRWAKVIDHDACIGCHACSTACKSENRVPVGVNRTYVKYVDGGTFPAARRSFQVTRCNQCAEPPCAIACPTAAMYQRDDGIVDFDKSICIGCKACIAACPYDAIFMNPEDHSAEKCNLCAHRLEVGLEPACVVVCPTEAILVGDLEDPASRVSTLVNRAPVTVRRPEKGTRPKLFYRGAHQSTLDPLAATRPGGGLFLWSEQTTGGHRVVSGHPGGDGSAPDGATPMDALLTRDRGTGGDGASASPSGNSSAAAMLAYDVPHSIPWDWRVSLYTWTKGIAAGVYLVAALMVSAGLMAPDAWLWRWATPVIGGAFLALTGALLIWDLEHPARFHTIFTRGRWESWLVKGAWIITAYSAVLALHFGASLAGAGELQRGLAVIGVPAALLTAVYTAYLFAQARARDLWQSPLLPPHMAVQSVLAGASALLLASPVVPEPSGIGWLPRIVGAAAGLHLLLVWGEVTLTHSTAHAKLATREMTRGRYARFFRVGVALAAVAVLAPWLAAVGAVVALIALLLHDHAYVQAGQSVPLA